MSECVVRMEMPQSCPCELAGGYDIPLPCFAGHGVPKRCKEFDECVEKGTKPDWCPFVCVLPEKHGRLVDADALLRDVEHYHVSDGKFQHWLELQHTIVPAEGSET